MTIQEFWNRAFIAALSRLPPKRAKKEADEATQLCIEQWQDQRQNWAPQYLTRWQDQEIDAVPVLLEDLELNAEGRIVRKKASKSLLQPRVHPTQTKNSIEASSTQSVLSKRRRRN